MAAQNKLFQRLIWLIDTIYSAGNITREEIDRRWAHAAYNDTHATEYGNRKPVSYTLPSGKWTAVCRHGKIDEQGLGQVSGQLKIGASEAVILFQ